MEDNIKQVVKDVKYLIATDCNDKTIQARIENYIKERDEALSIANVGISLRDYFAAEAMKAKIQVWGSDLPKKHRAALLEDIIERYGKTTVGEGLVRTCYDVADDMIKVREQ